MVSTSTSGVQMIMEHTGKSLSAVPISSITDPRRYHSHDSSLLTDGLYGAIHIRCVKIPKSTGLNWAKTFSRPSPDRENPFSRISSNPEDLKAMKEAEQNPILVVLSDWDHLTGIDYMQAIEDTGYDIL